MANGPSHPDEQLLKKRARSTEVLEGRANGAALIGPNEQLNQPSAGAAKGNG